MNSRTSQTRALVPLSSQFPAQPQRSDRLRRVIRRPARLGVSIIAVFVAGGIAWASLAPIAAGAIAPGIVSPDGSRRTVQHMEGGIIRQILARDGEEVAAGQVLLVLQETQAAAAHEVLADQANLLEATQARLVAEQIGHDAILFPSDLSAATDAHTRALIQGQMALFEKRRATLRAQIGVLDDRERQYEEQIAALTAQLHSTDAQIELIAEELDSKTQLFKKGLVAKPELLGLERAKAALEGDRGRLIGSTAEVRQRIGETETQRISVTAERAQDVSEELEKVRTDLAMALERVAASRDVLSRTVITAPVAGKVVNSRFKTDGGVIRPGEPVLDIVPSGEQLLIDARVAPVDIDVVTAGLEAVVHLNAYSNRGMRRIHGTVREVSADRIVDPNSGQPYFLARVEVSRKDMEELGKDIVLLPGMPAEIMIVTGERTVMGYLLEPFIAAFRRGMHET